MDKLSGKKYEALSEGAKDLVKTQVAIAYIEKFGLQKYANAMADATSDYAIFFRINAEKIAEDFGKKGGTQLKDLAKLQNKLDDLTKPKSK